MLKTCSQCQLSKSTEDFYKDKRRKDGLHSACKACHYKGMRTTANKESHKKMQKDWQVKHPNHQLLYGARHRAKKLGVPFDLTMEDILIPETCPVLGIPIIRGKDSKFDNSPSLDRIIPSKGYVKGNVVVMSLRANRIKNDAALGELEQIVAFLKKMGDANPADVTGGDSIALPSTP